MTPFFLVYFRYARYGPRARPRQGRPDRRLQPPQLPRPLRDRRRPALAPADQLRRQGGAVRAPLAGLDPLPPGRLSDSPRRVRRGVDGDRAHGGRARRHGLHLPRGDANPQRHAGDAQARRRPARPADRRAGVPTAVFGTEHVRRGWRIRPRKVKVRLGKAMTFPRASEPSPPLAESVTARIWPNVLLQWEDLGGLPPMRRAAVIGAGSWGTAVAVLLARGGLEVQLGDPDRGAGGRDDEVARKPPLPRGGASCPTRLAGAAGLRDRAGRPRPGLPGDPLRLAAAGGRGDRRSGQRPLLGAAADQGPDRPARPASRRVRGRAGAGPGARLPRRSGSRARGRLRLGRPRPRLGRRRPARPARRGLRPRGPRLRALAGT